MLVSFWPPSDIRLRGKWTYLRWLLIKHTQREQHRNQCSCITRAAKWRNIKKRNRNKWMELGEDYEKEIQEFLRQWSKIRDKIKFIGKVKPDFGRHSMKTKTYSVSEWVKELQKNWIQWMYLMSINIHRSWRRNGGTEWITEKFWLNKWTSASNMGSWHPM